MPSIQCKLCGGMVELADGKTVGECPYCGSMTTFPKLDSDRREQLYGRAEHYRAEGNFDRAIAAYEELLKEDADDAEAYWGLVISRFGIEYVEDPVSHERIPTCHRVQYESILADSDYRSALEKAGASERDVYESEAKRIAEIQKGILAISSQEKPFDVFICYKETTDGGTRTKDSTVAQDIYYQLTSAGYKVFFARITLEDKLGRQYEPYIFAALNSAKVMLVIGSKREYFNAVWVRNEWSRYLALMKKDRSRLLIPCYRDMDPYDLPDELSMLQSQDMSKIGFIQDLLRGIQKVVAKEEKKAPETGAGGSSSGGGQKANFLKRIRMFLESGEFDNAAEYCNRVLDMDPECGEAIFHRMLASRKSVSEDDLAGKDGVTSSLLNDKQYQMALRFADTDLKQRLERFAAVLKQKDECRKLLDEMDNYLNSDKFLQLPMLEQLDRKLEFAGRFSPLTLWKKAVEAAARINDECEAERQKFLADERRIFDDARTRMDGGELAPDEYRALADKLSKIESIPEAKQLAETAEQRHYLARHRIALARMEELRKQGISASQDDWETLEIELYTIKSHVSDAEADIAKCHYYIDAKNKKRKKIIVSAVVAVLAVIGIIGAVNLIATSVKVREISNSINAAIEAEQWDDATRYIGELRNVDAGKADEFEHSIMCSEISKSLVVVSPGTFNMNSSYHVTISKAFWIGKYEVTQSQWKAVMGSNPSWFKGDNLPVEEVSWNDAMEFCEKLNRMTEGSRPKGYMFSLPTEAQWEYAARGGSKSSGYEYSGSDDCDEVAWYEDNSGSKTHEVGTKKPNELGIHDMSGNVWEWCLDWYGDYPSGSVTDPTGPSSGSHRVLRGGGWYDYARYCRVALRLSNVPSHRDRYLGFRLSLVPVK